MEKKVLFIRCWRIAQTLFALLMLGACAGDPDSRDVSKLTLSAASSSAELGQFPVCTVSGRCWRCTREICIEEPCPLSGEVDACGMDSDTGGLSDMLEAELNFRIDDGELLGQFFDPLSKEDDDEGNELLTRASVDAEAECGNCYNGTELACAPGVSPEEVIKGRVAEGIPSWKQCILVKFSAHWSVPCRRFDEKLLLLQKKFPCVSIKECDVDRPEPGCPAFPGGSVPQIFWGSSDGLNVMLGAQIGAGFTCFDFLEDVLRTAGCGCFCGCTTEGGGWCFAESEISMPADFRNYSCGHKTNCEKTLRSKCTPAFVPTPRPTFIATPRPTFVPTPRPTFVRTPVPTFVPTPRPTFAPTPRPTYVRTPVPSFVPTPRPTFVPTPRPTFVPTPRPGLNPR